MRCFLAIELPDHIHDRLAGLQERMNALGRAVRWTKPENIHLTLEFLGEVPDADVPAVADVARSVAGRFGPFELDIGGTGCFPPHGPARIVWAGVANPPQTLIDCQKACEQAFAKIGFKPENRSYRPHLTVGRVRDPRDRRAGEQIRSAVESQAAFSAGTFAVEQLTLFQSILDRSGPTYIVIAHCPLIVTQAS